MALLTHGNVERRSLTPGDFRADLTEAAILELVWKELEADWPRNAAIEITVTPEIDLGLVTTDRVWLDVPCRLAGGYMVVSIQRSFLGDRYLLMRHDMGPHVPTKRVAL